MRRLMLVVLVSAAAISVPGGAASGQVPSADRLVELMIEANRGWLQPEPENLSYRLEASHLPVDLPVEPGRALPTAWDYQEVLTVHYRAPRHLRAESDRGSLLLLPDGRGFRFDGAVQPEEWDSRRARRYLYGIGYNGAAWALGQGRGDWELGEPVAEVVDGVDCFRIHGARKGGAPTPDRQVRVQERHRCDAFDLWLDAESHRPVRETLAWTEGEQAPRWARYLDYRPLPGGGQAPMRIEVYTGTVDDYLPDAEPRAVYEYGLIDGKVWFLRGWHDMLWSMAVTRAALDTIPIPVFYDSRKLDALAKTDQLEQDLDKYRTTQGWEDLLRTCIEITRLFPRHHKANSTVWILYFWHGDYDKAITAAELAADDPLALGGIYLAWAYDAAGRRDDALRTYREIVDSAPNDQTLAAAQAGSEQVWVPVAKRLRPRADEVMAAKNRRWRARASHQQADAALAIDGGRRTRWTSGAVQEPGMWFLVDLGEAITISRVAFDHIGDLTMYYSDYPRRYVVEVSGDGTAWEQVAEGAGSPDGVVEAGFDPRPVSQVRIRQEGTARPYHWSIHEVYLYSPLPG